MTLVKREVLETGRGSNRPHCVENSLWHRMWTFLKTDCVMD